MAVLRHVYRERIGKTFSCLLVQNMGIVQVLSLAQKHSLSYNFASLELFPPLIEYEEKFSICESISAFRKRKLFMGIFRLKVKSGLKIMIPKKQKASLGQIPLLMNISQNFGYN